jgi:hypothetical protein
VVSCHVLIRTDALLVDRDLDKANTSRMAHPRHGCSREVSHPPSEEPQLFRCQPQQPLKGHPGLGDGECERFIILCPPGLPASLVIFFSFSFPFHTTTDEASAEG